MLMPKFQIKIFNANLFLIFFFIGEVFIDREEVDQIIFKVVVIDKNTKVGENNIDSNSFLNLKSNLTYFTRNTP